jgi:hypothetical protein
MMNVKPSMEWELAKETEVLGENLPQCHFVQNKSHMTWPGSNPGRHGGKLANNHLRYGMALYHQVALYIYIYMCVLVVLKYRTFSRRGNGTCSVERWNVSPRLPCPSPLATAHTANATMVGIREVFEDWIIYIFMRCEACLQAEVGHFQHLL